jgi:O-acetyl-ADP-ribose deacetylase (regulator of RNase III)
MAEIEYVTGDALEPRDVKGCERKLIVHCCNTQGVMGAGIALAIARKWPIVKDEYVLWHMQTKFPGGSSWVSSASDLPLGAIQIVAVHRKLRVVNLIGQTLGYSDEKPPIRYEAIEKGFRTLRKFITLDYEGCSAKYSVHMPMMGSGLAGGKWSEVELLVEKELCDYDIPVTVYSL